MFGFQFYTPFGFGFMPMPGGPSPQPRPQAEAPVEDEVSDADFKAALETYLRDEAAKLPGFSGPETHCPKCGNGSPQGEVLSRHRDEIKPDYNGYGPAPRPERIERTCGHCGYTWDESPIDVIVAPLESQKGLINDSLKEETQEETQDETEDGYKDCYDDEGYPQEEPPTFGDPDGDGGNN